MKFIVSLGSCSLNEIQAGNLKRNTRRNGIHEADCCSYCRRYGHSHEVRACQGAPSTRRSSPIQHVLNAAAGVEPEKIILVLGHQADRVRSAVASIGKSCSRPSSSHRHAVQQTRSDFPGADPLCPVRHTPLITSKTLNDLINFIGVRATVSLITLR